MRTAIVYDRVNKWGGAERVLLSLHKIFPQACLFTSVYNPKGAPWAKVFPKIHTSFLQSFPLAKCNHEFFAFLMPLAFESLDLARFDLVISVTSEAAKGIITKPGTLHICYCLTPTRYLWSGYELYFKNPVLKLFSRPIVNYLRKWDKIAAQRPDVMIGISSEVQKRIKKYYQRQSQVIFPPFNSKSLLNINKGNTQKDLPKDFYLVVSRLVPYKKVELAIKAFNKLGLTLCIIGKGREEGKLKSMSQKNIRFLEEVSEETLCLYYKKAKALIMPQEEEFGLVSLEAQSLGTPVIAYKKGGVQDNIIDGETGIFFKKQTEESLISAIKKFEGLPADRWGMKFEKENLIKNAQRFSEDVFKKEFLGIIKDNLKKI